ncbi:MAG: hypothetical protein GTN89_10300, partial [Acidobacteria bacterium]|nr:hypothetical protein [Acidobacteriota bacterium]NIO57985.1 hypothetical protein [Acidobacteriota bacterium]NIQ30742.1 hypothetical protein [Acidobacteriota bacterium]NIQ85753.1 hypothetical protein [Acidobacteriota bacterium]
SGATLPEDDEIQTGRDYVERFLEPLARSERLRGAVREHTEVLAIGRDRLLKTDLIGGERHTHPFRLLLRANGVESTEHADVVLDCSGTWRHANALGNGGIPAPGETEAAGAIRYRLDDILGADRARYEGKRVLLVGAGHSAATALDQLRQLEGATTIWVRRSDGGEPYVLQEHDPLPERDRLNRLGNRIAGGTEPGFEVRAATLVERLTKTPSGAVRVTLAGARGEETVEVDAILALVGYRPDREIYRELQVHECWATMGPMKLAASLMASDAADCLAQSSAGAETLTSPEPGFFILGAKSYGKNVNFLIRLGLEQIRDAFTLIDGDPTLDLYEENAVV